MSKAKLWWHRVATIWTLGSWAFLIIFVIPWAMDGWTGTLLLGLSLLGGLVWLGIVVMFTWNYIAERRGRITRGEAWAIFGWSSLMWGPFAFVVLYWLGGVIGLR